MSQKTSIKILRNSIKSKKLKKFTTGKKKIKEKIPKGYTLTSNIITTNKNKTAIAPT